MKNTKKIFYASLTAIVIGGLATGCSSDDPEELETPETTEGVTREADYSEEGVVDLTDWIGTWNSVTYYLDEPEVQEAYEELAEQEDSTIEVAKENYQEKVSTDFIAMTIEKNQITFLDNPENEGGEALETVTYEYQEEQTMEHGGQELSWFKFVATEDAVHEVILLLDVHGEESMPHFHFRYGTADEDLLMMGDWYPTLVSPTTTLDQVYEEIAD